MASLPEPLPRAATGGSIRNLPFRRLVALARPERRNIALGTACLVVASAMNLAFPQAIRVIVDGALSEKDQALIDRATLALFVIFVIQGVAVALRYMLFTISGERIVARLRLDLYQSLLSQETAFFDERRTGELTSRLSADTTVLQNTVSANVSIALRNLAAVFGGTALLFYTSPVLTALMLAVVPPVALGAVVYGKRVRKLSRDLQDSLASANDVAEESLSGIRTVRAFAAEASEVSRYGRAIDASFRLARQRAFNAGAFFGSASFAAYAAAAVVLWYGSRMVMDGTLSIGALTSFLMYSLLVAFALGACGELYTDFMRASGAGERVFELLDRVPAMPCEGGIILPAPRGALRFEKVSFSYPARKAAGVLWGVDLCVAPGEVVALVGPSGSGKSTLAALLARMYDPQSGVVRFDGEDVRRLDPKWLREQIGTVAQEPLLFSSSIADNIRYGKISASPEAVEAAARAANAHGFIQGFPQGYDTLVGERGVQLSGGQKQRVAIARAVLKDPRILVLDEATSALDAESEHLVREALERLMRGRTTLVIAHRLSTVAGSDRVVVIEGGRIVQSGKHAALMAEEGLYRRLVERQFVTA
jgi:ATP-binding cassette subfamily B protein